MNHRFSLERHVQIPGSVRGRGRSALAVLVKPEHSLIKIKFAARTGQATETESYGDGCEGMSVSGYGFRSHRAPGAGEGCMR